ncbi:MAG: four helix bundle protein [Candidatus Absconditabacterales bacterium]
MESKKIEDLEIYKLSMDLSNICRGLYQKWDYSIKKITGDQFMRSIDSIGANISEGFGRFHYMDSVRFYYNARGSLFESKYRVKLLYERKTITKEDFIKIEKTLTTLGVKLNNFINYIKGKK